MSQLRHPRVYECRSTRYIAGGFEPSIDEMLSDPIVLALIRRDGFSAGEIRAMVGKIGRRLAVASLRARAALPWRACSNL
ncbi:MAG TPA: hypothetical protein VN832_08755 [Stellaceae bacterium]|nr:hypothetical protein [Stellaceae bacterium]